MATETPSPDVQKTVSGQPVTAEQAKTLIQNKVPGVTAEAIQIREESEDGEQRYEGWFCYDSMEYEFEMDPATGIVFDWNADFEG